jgi:hypothetical protein
MLTALSHLALLPSGIVVALSCTFFHAAWLVVVSGLDQDYVFYASPEFNEFAIYITV